MPQTDVIDQLLGDKAVPVAELRSHKSELATQMQAYYDSVFAPSPASARALSPTERWLIALRTAVHTGSTSAIAWYTDRAREAGASDQIIATTMDVSTIPNDTLRRTAIMRHVDLIVTHPVDSSRQDIEALTEAGLSPIGIVALSQVVAYVSYQVRLVAVFRALGATK